MRTLRPPSSDSTSGPSSGSRLSTLFHLDTGACADVEEVLKRADQQLADLARQAVETPAPGSEIAVLMQQGSERDSLTGTLARNGFSNALRRAFEATTGGSGPLSLAEVSIDNFKAIEQTCGNEVADEVLVGLAVLLKKHFEPAGGIVCRLAPDIFAAVLPRTARQLAVASSEDLRKDVQRASERWTSASAIKPAPQVTVSVGIASFELESHLYDKPEQLVGAAAKAVQASRSSGGNCIRVFAPKAAA
jgi:diguanylate cyclase